MSRTSLPWIALVFLGVFAMVFWDRAPTSLIPSASKPEQVFPYAFMENIETLEFDTEGMLRYRLSTPNAHHFQQDNDQPGPEDYTLVRQPHLIFYPANESQPWIIRADQGRTRADGREVSLNIGVLAEQHSARQGLIQVETDALRVDIVEQYAETDKAVKMRAQQGQLETLGMRAYLSEDRIELLSQVRGVYAP